MSLDVSRSGDGRLRTCEYERGGAGRFCVSEPVAGGVLITEFSKRGAVVDQAYASGSDALSELSRFLGRADLEVRDAKTYEAVKVDAACTACGSSVSRELDTKTLEAVTDIPVVPMFVCGKCGKRFYSMSGQYLRKLVESQRQLFEKEAIEALERDEGAFISELKANVIRIFASKKVSELRIED